MLVLVYSVSTVYKTYVVLHRRVLDSDPALSEICL